MVTGFVNTYFIATGDFDKSTMMFVNAFILLFCSIITVFFGFITRFINPNKMMLIASFGMTVFRNPFTSKHYFRRKNS